MLKGLRGLDSKDAGSDCRAESEGDEIEKLT